MWSWNKDIRGIMVLPYQVLHGDMKRWMMDIGLSCKKWEQANPRPTEQVVTISIESFCSPVCINWLQGIASSGKLGAIMFDEAHGLVEGIKGSGRPMEQVSGSWWREDAQSCSVLPPSPLISWMTFFFVRWCVENTPLLVPQGCQMLSCTKLYMQQGMRIKRWRPFSSISIPWGSTKCCGIKQVHLGVHKWQSETM